MEFEITQYELDGDVVRLAWVRDGAEHERTVTASKVDTIEKLASWIMVQPVVVTEPRQASDFYNDLRNCLG